MLRSEHNHHPEKPKPLTPRQRMASRRERLGAQGLRPVQHWVPDLRDPKVLAAIRREAKLMAQHPENDAIDAWNEPAYGWSAWKRSAGMSCWWWFQASQDDQDPE